MARSTFRSRRSYDLVCVVSRRNRRWILDAVALELARYFPGSVKFHYSLRHLPKGDNYFISHYSLFPPLMKRYSWLKERRTFVFFTHPTESLAQILNDLKECTRLISMSTLHAVQLQRLGFPPERLSIAVPGADPRMFRSHHRGGGAVGFCSAYYPRKSPSRLMEIVRSLPDMEFILLGRGWNRSPYSRDIESLQNLTYAEASYGEYPNYYDKMDVFVSPSLLEGGPVPLLEAMMSNVVPVATRTGFAPDLIQHGENGFLCDIHFSIDEMSELIERARRLDIDVRKTVEHLTWEAFSLSVQEIMFG